MSKRLVWALSGLLLLLPCATPLHADEPATPAKADKAEPAEPAKADKAEPTKTPPVQIKEADYGKFERLGQWGLAPNGRWLAYQLRRGDGENSLELRAVDDVAGPVTPDKTEATFKYGTGPTFSADSRWFAFKIGVSEKMREKAAKSKQPLPAKIGLYDITKKEQTELKGIASFAFSDDGAFLLLRKEKPRGQKHGGADLIVRELASGRDTILGNVSSYRFNDDGTLLALIVDAHGKIGNAIQLFDAKTGNLRTLDTKAETYKSLVWRKDAADLAVLREREHAKDEDAAYVVLTWRGLDGKAPRAATFDHLAHKTFPKTRRVVDSGGLRWSANGAGVFFGTKDWKNKPKDKGKAQDKGKAKDKGKQPKAKDKGKQPKADAESKKPKADAKPKPAGTKQPAKPADADSKAKPASKATKKPKASKKKPAAKSLKESLKEPSGVEIWHAKDVEIQPRQKKTAARRKRRSDLAVWWIKADKFVQLGINETERLRVTKPHTQAVSTDNQPWEAQKRFGPVLNNVTLVDTFTGARKQVLTKTKYQFGLSPDARFLLYLKGGNYWTYDTQDDKHRNLTGKLGTAFVNAEPKTLTDEPPPYGIAGWSEDGGTVFLYDKYDIWRIATDGSLARRVTDGVDNQTRYRREIFDREDDEFIDPSKPMFVSLYGDRTKQSGYARIKGIDNYPSSAPIKENRLIWKDQRLTRLVKAKQAKVFAFVAETFNDSPDIFVAGTDLATARQVSKTNPFQKDYLWGRSTLITYENAHGQELQGALYYPAGYVKGKQYPMIVDIYELRSQNLHRYSTPTERNPYSASVFTTQGYFVFTPDIVYRAQNPGLSAVECVVPAVEAVLAREEVDPKRVGLVGHSWGAYQTAFIVTQTDVFAAGVAGAPLTNMMSMSMNIYWNSGQSNTRIFHESQGRMDKPFWRDVETYIKNSPIFHIEALNTPLLIAFGDKDGAVDWHQGIEMYSAARLANRPLVMLVYPGENHGLRKKPNQVDYHHRVRHWFDHHLKGVKAEPWVSKGKTHEARREELEALKKKRGEGKR